MIQSVVLVARGAFTAVVAFESVGAGCVMGFGEGEVGGGCGGWG